MATCPPSLTWMLVKDQNAFMHKRNGQTARSGSVTLSGEPFNLTNTHSFKASGLANEQAVGVSYDEGAKVPLTLALKVKKAAAKPAKQVAKTPLKKNFRRVAKAITSQTAGQYYRADLKDAALQRWSSVYRFAMVKKGLKKPAKGKYGRKSDSA